VLVRAEGSYGSFLDQNLAKDPVVDLRQDAMIGMLAGRPTVAVVRSRTPLGLGIESGVVPAAAGHDPQSKAGEARPGLRVCPETWAHLRPSLTSDKQRQRRSFAVFPHVSAVDLDHLSP
jgi:hypothetical protein